MRRRPPRDAIQAAGANSLNISRRSKAAAHVQKIATAVIDGVEKEEKIKTTNVRKHIASKYNERGSLPSVDNKKLRNPEDFSPKKMNSK